MKSNLTEQSVIDRIRKGEIKPNTDADVETPPIEKKKTDTDNIIPKAVKLTSEAEFCKKHILSIAKFSKKNWTTIGTIAYRKVAGTDVWSEHAKGNAIDWHGSASTMQQLADYLVKNSYELHVQNVIYNKEIWNYPRGWHKYDGVDPHTTHVHVDFTKNPKKPKFETDNISKQIYLHKNIAKFKTELYDMLMGNPSEYFGKYSSYIFGDDEETAYKYFVKAIDIRKKQLKLDIIYNNKYLSKWDKLNIDNLNYIIKDAGERIRREIASIARIGDAITITWYYPNTKTGKWYQRDIEFEFDYL